ncbi:DUF370 domain-containing protein [Bacillus aquiflavi]|uniref:DUF370 domain-containing protein n=1 Tax=Bacillus aquiflavi TaxID=2672567 RepID=A0A6B3W034_9BACI|nr:extracellular matrix/biofilm biosynthesis regulator RemA family protein [Bacillus aquiflavi]MBA4537668.1 DUF370 domain-containing protein [Bacillus aquiflavi]NEY81925.1 DUF370 domain-containing protein [Bacillus aquiflavi]UAC48196.1 DUF370 domain-containing protein [Bacillus aquiflavi]
MYVHIGEDTLVKSNDIIVIIDKNSMDNTANSRKFLEDIDDHVVNLAKNNYKSVVVTEDKVYLSPISSLTLKKRSQKLIIQDFSNE